MQSVLELANLAFELADSSANPAKLGVWVRAFGPFEACPTLVRAGS